MISFMEDLPKIGEVIVCNDNPTYEVEKLKCVMIKPDPEMAGIKYAFFASCDDDKLNTHEEDGVKFYTMRGYTESN